MEVPVSSQKHIVPPVLPLFWPVVLCRAGVTRSRTWLQITSSWKHAGKCPSSEATGRSRSNSFWASSTGSRASTKWSWNELAVKISLCPLAGVVGSHNCHKKAGVSTGWTWYHLQLTASQSYRKLECSVTGTEITWTEQQQHLSSQLCRSWSCRTELEF